MKPTDLLQTIALVVTITAFIVSQLRNRKTENANAFRILGEMYDRIVVERLEYPQVLTLAQQWRRGDIEKVGQGAGAKDKYYSYGELCVGFVTACLYYRETGLISKRNLESYFAGLMKLVAEENTAFFRDVTGKTYCSEAFRLWFREWEHKNPEPAQVNNPDAELVSPTLIKPR